MPFVGREGILTNERDSVSLAFARHILTLGATASLQASSMELLLVQQRLHKCKDTQPQLSRAYTGYYIN